jgi:hypothetical protein
MQLRPDGWPRRADLMLMTPAELAVRNAVLAVEAAGCHTLLTEAVILLGQAQDKVADFVELPPAPMVIDTTQACVVTFNGNASAPTIPPGFLK